jgi:hypothetical protein
VKEIEMLSEKEILESAESPNPTPNLTFSQACLPVVGWVRLSRLALSDIVGKFRFTFLPSKPDIYIIEDAGLKTQDAEDSLSSAIHCLVS